MDSQKINKEQGNKEYYTIDVMQILRALWHKAWALLLAALIAGGSAFCYANFFIEPRYSSSIMLYVNNGGVSVNGFSISTSQIAAAQSLVKTYTEILSNRTTLERVIEKSGVSYSYKQLAGMIKAAPSNETEIMKVTVTTTDPYEAARIANTIAEVLPERISEIIENSSMEVVDSAVPELQKVSPSITKYTAIGLLLGGLVAAAFVVISALMDDTIHDEDYILNNYKYPVLAKVPDLQGNGGKRYGYRKYGYYYSRYHKDNKVYAENAENKE